MADELLDSLEGVPEFLHGQFAKVEVDGAEKYRHQPPRAADPDSVGAKERARRADKRREEMENELKALQERYAIDGELIDPELIRSLLDERRAREGKELIPRTEAEKEKAELREKIHAALKKDLDARDARIGELETTLERVLIDEGIARTSSDPNLPFRLRKGAATLLTKLAKADKAFKVVDGKPVPMDGDRPMEKDDGSPAALVDWIAAKANEYGLIEDSQGSGSQPPLNGSAPKKRKSEMTMDDKIAYIKKYGQDAYTALPH